MALSAAGAPYQRVNVQELHERVTDSLNCSTHYLGIGDENHHRTAFLDPSLSKILHPRLVAAALGHLAGPGWG